MRSLFIILCILTFSLNTFTITAQVSEDGPITTLGTITNDGDGFYVPHEFCLDPDNKLIVRTNIVLGGLTIVGDEPNEYGVLPSNVPPMYIEYTVNGEVLPPVQVGNFDLVTLSNGYPAFSHIAKSPAVDFSEKCEESSADYVFGSIKYRLVTPNGDGWSVYPACNYAQSWGMFSCNVYSYAPWCNTSINTSSFSGPTNPGPTPQCSNEWFSGKLNAKMYCDCGDIKIPHEEEPVKDDADTFKGGDNNGDTERRFDGNNEIYAYPNPMGQNLMIKSKGELIRKIEIYNSRGDLMIQKNYNFKENQIISLNTEEFPNGLYLTRVLTNTGIKVIKVLK